MGGGARDPPMGGGVRDPPMGGGVRDAPLDFQGPLANSMHSTTTIVKRMQSHKK